SMQRRGYGSTASRAAPSDLGQGGVRSRMAAASFVGAGLAKATHLPWWGRCTTRRHSGAPGTRAGEATCQSIRRSQYADELRGWRRDIHAHPELGFDEHRTSTFVADQLARFGCEVHRAIGRTGVVGVLRAGNGPKSIGLRADMDALPILEANRFAYRSQNEGRMHACGHDGHTTMLLGAARYLAQTRSFDGTVNFIFQPAEEGL